MATYLVPGNSGMHNMYMHPHKPHPQFCMQSPSTRELTFRLIHYVQMTENTHPIDELLALIRNDEAGTTIHTEELHAKKININIKFSC